MGDWAKPVLTDPYASFRSYLDDRLNDAILAGDPAHVTMTNTPTYAMRFTSASSKWQTWNGTTWADSSALYAINISGNAATATYATSAGSATTATTATTATSATSATTASTATTATTATTANALNTSNNYQVNSLGVGTSGSGTAGEIRATNNITAYYSDERLKDIVGPIAHALDKVKSLRGFYFVPNERAVELGYTPELQVGVSAQAVERVMPEVIKPAPINFAHEEGRPDLDYKTLDYAKLVPLLIEAVKELATKVGA